MTASQAIRRARIGAGVEALPRWADATALALLCLVSLWLRTRVLGAGFWIDEGISVGIAHHPLTSIPHLLRQDGSPPLYYLLLHVWIGWFGDGERATRALSLLFALAFVPLVFWVARSCFGRAAAWVCASIAAVDPYLTYYAQETRMYTLAALLALVATAAFVRGVIEGRRRWLVVLVVSLDLLLYTHNWGLFFAIGLAVATALFGREHWRAAAVAGVAVALVYAPWLPTLLYQAAHTGAPWAMRPGARALVLAPGSVFAGDVAFGALALAAGIGLARRRREAAPMALLTLAAATVVVAWTESQVASSWTSRYFAVLLGPLLLAVGAGVVRAGRSGIAALAFALFLWAGYTLHDDKSNARAIAHGVAAYVQPGTVVLTTHPEQTPVLRYYLGPVPRFTTQLGPVPDPRLMDWRDALDRIGAVTVRRNLEPVLDSVAPGRYLVVVSPVFRDYRAWQAPWTSEVYRTSQLWTAAIAADPRFREVATVTSDEIRLERNYWKPLQAAVYRRHG